MDENLGMNKSKDWFATIIENFYNDLLNGENVRYLELFSKLQIQIEGWFRGELMNYIDRNHCGMTVENREVPIPNDKRKKVDLKVKCPKHENYWIELKHILVGCQKVSQFNLNSYFYNGKTGSNIANDIIKLRKLGNSADSKNKLIIVFVSTNEQFEDECKKKNGSLENYIIKDNKDLQSKIKAIKNEDSKNNHRYDDADLEDSNYNGKAHFGYFILRIRD